MLFYDILPLSRVLKGSSSVIVAFLRYLYIYGFRLPQSPGPEVIKKFSCSTQLSMKFSLLINTKMPTIVGIFIFISIEFFMLGYV